MRLLSRLDDERKSGAIWYVIFRQSPKASSQRRMFIVPTSTSPALIAIQLAPDVHEKGRASCPVAKRVIFGRSRPTLPVRRAASSEFTTIRSRALG
jgi:hypothetical protein